MAHDPTCFYCARDQRLDDLMIEVCPLEASTLYLFKDQTHPGRCIVALGDHKRELFELTAQERTAYAEDIAKAARAIQDVCKPDKINYGAFGDKNSHFHMHLVPKFEGSVAWGSMFEMSPAEKKFLPADELKALANKIKAKIGG